MKHFNKRAYLKEDLPCKHLPLTLFKVSNRNKRKVLNKQKSTIDIPLINYWLKLRRAFSRQRLSCTNKKILVKVGFGGEPVPTPSCCL